MDTEQPSDPVISAQPASQLTLPFDKSYCRITPDSCETVLARTVNCLVHVPGLKSYLGNIRKSGCSIGALRKYRHCYVGLVQIRSPDGPLSHHVVRHEHQLIRCDKYKCIVGRQDRSDDNACKTHPIVRTTSYFDPQTFPVLYIPFDDPLPKTRSQLGNKSAVSPETTPEMSRSLSHPLNRP